MNFGPIDPRGQAHVVPAGSVLGWWCVMDGKRVVEMTADVVSARAFCRAYNRRNECSELCAAHCRGAPEFRSSPSSR